MASWRCSTCAINWPAEPDKSIKPADAAAGIAEVDPSFEVCEQCLAPADFMANQDPLDAGTARILKLWCAFEHYYANRPAGDVTSLAA